MAGSPRKRLAAAVRRGLHRLYPAADCELAHENALELLVATILSAQSTDQRVNQVTRSLFSKYRTAADYAEADPATLEGEIHSTGFYRNKTKSLIGMGRGLVERYGGQVPRRLEQLVTLPGVARKTANVVLGTAYGIPSGFVVDTHVRRVAYRLGLSDESDPEAIERDLMELFPSSDWIFLGHALIWLGRRLCHARRPECEACAMATICPRRGVEPARPRPQASVARARGSSGATPGASRAGSEPKAGKRVGARGAQAGGRVAARPGTRRGSTQPAGGGRATVAKRGSR